MHGAQEGKDGTGKRMIIANVTFPIYQKMLLSMSPLEPDGPEELRQGVHRVHSFLK